MSFSVHSIGDASMSLWPRPSMTTKTVPSVERYGRVEKPRGKSWRAELIVGIAGPPVRGFT